MLVEMLNVFHFHLRQEDVSEADTREPAQHITRMSLMSDSNTVCIGKSERHHKVLEMAHGSVEAYLPFVALTNCMQMVRVAKVKILESLRTLKWTKSQWRVSV